jgi:hypothetical protein
MQFRLRRNATTTPRIRRGIQHSQASIEVLATTRFKSGEELTETPQALCLSIQPIETPASTGTSPTNLSPETVANYPSTAIS